jgi:hypothetical protein
MAGERLARIFSSVKYSCVKHDTYFPVYERVLERFIGKGITFVEIGVLDGGSLFMWREYFKNARIIGIDFNPSVRKWEPHGFEIFIADQSSPSFWEKFYRTVGAIDVVLDDGGHTNAQQIVTAKHAIEHIRDGGVLMVEDAHTSYLKAFGNPSKYSFINFGKHIVDSINSRFPAVPGPRNEYSRRIHSVEFYESIVVFNIDSSRCLVPNRVTNGGEVSNTEDYRFKDSGVEFARSFLASRLSILKRIPLARRWSSALFGWINVLAIRLRNRRLAKFFR